MIDIDIQKNTDGTTTVSIRLSDAETAKLIQQLTEPNKPETVSPAKARLIRYRIG
ncbi:hypothetical protein MPRG_11800 [Mycobacterium paragordonae]|uniref:Uncharacterized protein n=1 Tax=Mycobacterium paragordonae TaxID=1389713 RepID=A0ABQ1C0Z6_9MYCO|nr:hypothetical protein MPRG_11800 [Mycobacterium paragordonae]